MQNEILISVQTDGCEAQEGAESSISRARQKIVSPQCRLLPHTKMSYFN